MAQRAGNLSGKKVPDEIRAELEQGFKAAVKKQSTKKRRASAMDVIPVANLKIPKRSESGGNASSEYVTRSTDSRERASA